MERRVLVLLVLGLLAISFGQTAFMFYTSFKIISDTPLTAQVSRSALGVISLCINYPPSISFGCDTSHLLQNDFFTCNITAFDPENTSLTFFFDSLSGYMGGTIDENGVFAVSLVQNTTGVSLVSFTVRDNSTCGMLTSSVNVTFNVTDINDPPIYDVPIGPNGNEKLSWNQGETLRGLYLNDHFSDPEGEPMTFKYFSFSSEFTFSILPSSEVLINHSSCGVGNVIFQAKDPLNLTGDSSVIDLSVQCQTITTASSDSSGSGGGGGGGGSGGGASSAPSCQSKWVCGEWAKCRINGTQKKTCTDINGCADPYEQYFWQNCTYVPHCNDGIVNYDEQGLDCGGYECPICETCYDGKLNNLEVEIDCGGPYCNSCSNCNDGIENYQEIGLDCGGPSCEPCPTCTDSIQNQNETAVDCGGPFCSPCTRINAPVLLEGNKDKNELNLILMGVFLSLSSLAFVYVLFRNKINALLTKWLLSLTLKHKKQILLLDDQKYSLLLELKDLEAKDFITKNKLVIFQDCLGRLQRKFFSYFVDSAVDKSLVFLRIDKLQGTRNVKSFLKKQYLSLLKLERHKGFSKLDLELSLEFFRTSIYNVSKVTKEEIAREVVEYTQYTKPPVAVIKQFLYNGMLALQFNKLALAKENYLHALELYQTLDSTTQKKVYAELSLNFHHLSYMSSF